MHRTSWVRRLGIPLVVSALLLQVAPTASASVTERTPPYDFGYLHIPNIEKQWDDDARDGQLHGSVVPFVCIIYAPPFVLPCLQHV